MDRVLAGVAVVALLAVWWVKKGDWSRNETGRDVRPRPTPVAPPPALAAGSPSTSFRPEIEGLRAVAVVLVMLYHADFVAFAGGFIGVDVFFVLSGFLITSLLLRELGTTGTVGLGNFWARRARRLLPASALVIVATLLLGRLVLDGLSQMELGRDAAAAALFVANVRFYRVGTDYLANHVYESPLLHFWSLSVEEQFYLVWPWLLALLVRTMRLSRRALAVTIGVAGIASFVLCVWATNDQDWSTWAFFMLPARAWELLAGAGLALAGGRVLLGSPRLRAILGWIALGAVLACAIEYRSDMAFPGWLAAVPVVGTLLVVVCGGPDTPEGPRLLLTLRPMQWTGTRSYAIYLWHFPLLVLAGWEWGTAGQVSGLSPIVRVAILAVSVVIAAISYRFVENPVRHAPSLVGNAPRSLAIGGLLVMTSVVAAVVVVNNPPRLSTDVVAESPELVGATSVPAQGEEPPPADSVAEAAGAGSTTTVEGATTTTTVADGSDASHDNPADLAALIAANRPLLDKGIATQKVPSNLRPALAEAYGDLPQVYDNGCILDLGQSEAKLCLYGDVSGSQTVVLFGDSHAAQWMPALHQIASDNGWRLVVYTKKACPAADIATEKDPDETDCAPWREDVIRQIERLQPDLVVMSSYRYKAAGADVGRSTDEVWQEGLTRTVEQVRPLTDRLLLLGDTATPFTDVPSCLAGNLGNVSSCMSYRVDAVRPSRLAIERDIAAANDASFIPTSDWMCTDLGCPVIVGDVLMYRDDSHLTATAARLLAPYLDAALKSVLAGR